MDNRCPLWISILLALLIALPACGGVKGADTSALPAFGEPAEVLQADVETVHNLWGYFKVAYSGTSDKIELVPVREINTHWNVLRFLEQNPCDNCVKIKHIAPSGNGTLLIDVEVTHPFSDKFYTGFDVRGICMFNGSSGFPASQLTTQNRLSGDGQVINADGYTALYHGITAGSGPGGLQGYIQGDMASPIAPNASLNAYKRFITVDAANTRNAFYTGSAITRTYEIDMPDAASEFGYAVDACWTVPTANPVGDPMNDFPPSANCPEPWKVVVTEEKIGPGLTDQGGQSKIGIKVYDWQGKNSHYSPTLECPGIWEGKAPTLWMSDGADPEPYAYFEAIVGNFTPAPAGVYQCLVGVQDQKNDIAPSWLDLTAYQIINLEVTTAQLTSHEIWYYERNNLLVDSALDEAISRLQTAADAGYSTVVLADFKMATIDIQSETYWQHVQTYVAAAASAGIKIVPALVDIGYSDAVLCHDPNLMEGQPVVDARFKVTGNTADVVQDSSTVFTNGNFENHSGDTFPGWIQMDGIGVGTFADTAIKHTGNASIRFDNFSSNPNGNDRIRQEVSVKPWNYYAISFWLRSENLQWPGSFNIIAFDSAFNKNLDFLSYNISETQGWTHYYSIFNSQDNETVNIYFGIWGGNSGRFWLDDITIENAGLINLLRRSGTPLKVTNLTGNVEYTEGADFFPVADPLLGEVGPYTGTFDLYHERPVITLTPGSAIQDGQELLVDYYHATFVYDMQAACCLTEDGVFDVFHNTLVKIDELIDPDGILISVDELRVANWCALCQSKGKTPGGLLADATQRVDQLAHEINPSWRLMVWNDMYDPNHNAHDDYYLANGTFANSWDGLPSSWDIGNWNQVNADSLSFFGGLGNRQVLCGFYDESGPDYSISEWLDLSKDIPGVYACMYTTWAHDFSQMGAWAQAVKDWDEANW